MINRFFNEELSRLKELGAEFANAYPSLAPRLGGPMTNPDVERLLEGVAFQTAMVRRKLEDDFPEIVHDMVRLVLPHYLRPVPATTIIAFTPNPSLGQSVSIPAGTQLSAVPVDGTSCRFSTAYDVEVHPLELLDAVIVQPSGMAPAIKLTLSLSGLTLSQWRPKSLRLFLSGEYVSAADLYYLLSRRVKNILLSPDGGGIPSQLPGDCLRPVGFADDESLLPYPPHAFPGFRLLQEYFSSPEKFLLFDLFGWERWRDRGEGTQFTLTMQLDCPTLGHLQIQRESFTLFAVPAINAFPHEADPIYLDHRSTRHLVRPSGQKPDHYQILSVDRVTGFKRNGADERPHTPFELFSSASRSAPVYHTSFQESPVRRAFDVSITTTYPDGSQPPELETLSIDLTCTNGALPENLHRGDISIPTAALPESVSFSNITPINPELTPPLDPDLLWKLTTHLSLNYQSLENAANLRSLLELYVFPDRRGRAVATANLKRIDGIEEVTQSPGNCQVKGVVMLGLDIRMKMRQDHFAGPGDLYLFGCVLNHFLGGYASINTFTRLTIDECLKGDRYQWPERLGSHPLL